MLDFKNIYILGYSGHSYVILDIALENKQEIVGYFDQAKANENPYHIPYLGNEKDLDKETIAANSCFFPSVGENALRKKLVRFLEFNSLRQTKVISNKAHISPTAKLGLSTLIGTFAVVNAKAILGKGCIINTGAIIEHEVQISDFVHIGPGAVLAGNVTVGEGTFVGANAVVKQDVQIGDNVIIGAGSVVVKDVPSNEIWMGNPAKKYKNNE